MANSPDGPPADFATRPADRQGTEDVCFPLRAVIALPYRLRQFRAI
jgi:hypothetical protein